MRQRYRSLPEPDKTVQDVKSGQPAVSSSPSGDAQEHEKTWLSGDESSENKQKKAIELVTSLGDVMDRLNSLLREEAANVFKRKNRELERQYIEKVQLHAEYMAAMERIKQASNGGKMDIPQELRTKMNERATTLAASMRHNRITIGAAAEASRRVVDMIVTAVRQQRQGAAGYALDAAGSLTGTAGNAQAVTLDQRF